MPKESDIRNLPREACLTDDELYGYISGQGESDGLAGTEVHLVKCPDCRKALAGLLKLLHPDMEDSIDEIPAPSKEELDRTLTFIREVSEKERSGSQNVSPWFKWAVAAAAVLGFIAIGLIGLKYVYERNKSTEFFTQAKSIVEQSYTGASPSNLRLALPFRSTSTNRSIDSHSALRSAENLFYQALAVRENMVEARLGLAYVYLNLAAFEHSQEEFQKALNIQDGNVQALVGRGIARYEQAIAGLDPGKRITLLDGAAKDFDSALELNDDCAEARYNKIWTLYESGLHREALRQIEEYLSRDSESIWAEGLRNLRVKIRATNTDTVEEEIHKEAQLRDSAALERTARLAPYQMPPAIWSTMRQSLQLEKASLSNDDVHSEDLRWAASILEVAYSAATGDKSFRALLDFYDELSPSRRARKKKLDQDFQALVKLHREGKFEEVLYSSEFLKDQYLTLNDRWQIYNLHHLRGNCLYLGRADFEGAYDEFQKMHEIGKDFDSPYLIAKALGSLAMICGVQGKYDESRSHAYTMKDLARIHNLDSIQAYAYIILGDQFRRLGQLEQSIPEYANALGFANRLHNESRVIEILEDLGVVMNRLDRLQMAKEFFDLALHRLETGLREETIPDIPEIISRRLNLLYQRGNLALRTGDLTSARTFFQTSLKSIPAGMHEMEARNYIGLADVYLCERKIPEAEDMLEEALGANASGQYPEIEWQSRFIQGEISKERGEYQKALSSYQQAIDVLEGMRKSITPEELKRSFFTDRFDPYKAIVALLSGPIDNQRQALEFVDRSKSKTLKEYLNLPGFPAEKLEDSRNNAINQDSALVVEYFFTNEGLTVFVTEQDRIETVSLDITAAVLTPMIQQYLDSIKNNDSETFSILSSRLYDALIAPIETIALVGKPETLVILPDGPLHLLPFAGLKDPDGRFLVERTSLVFAPSRSVFQYCLFLNRSATHSSEPGVLLIDGSAGLFSARDELVQIAKLYGGNVSSVGPKDLPLFGQKAARSGIIHFAGHAVDRRGSPVLLLQTIPEAIYLDCRVIDEWELPKTQLVNLSGCSTGIGPMGEGEAPWGLIPAFLNAGAPAIIASLTPVDDAMTGLLNRNFYEQLKKHTGKAKALQTAQLALLDSARSNHEIKPQSWVPYILVGDPR
jgi:CHAT domain-containing protein